MKHGLTSTLSKNILQPELAVQSCMKSKATNLYVYRYFSIDISYNKQHHFYIEWFNKKKEKERGTKNQ